MKRILILFLSIILVQQIFAQYDTDRVNLSQVTSTSNFNTVERVNLMLQGIMSSYHFGKSPEELNEALLEDVEGTPYLNKSFIDGDIITVKGEVLNGVPLRYNMYDNVMEVKVKDIPYVIPSEKLVKRVILENRKFDYLTFQIGKKQQTGFLELVDEGDISIYSYVEVEFKQAEPPKPMQEKPKPARFINRKPIFLLKIENVAVAVKNKRQLVNLLHDHKKEMQIYTKKYPSCLNDKEGIKKLINYYLSL